MSILAHRNGILEAAGPSLLAKMGQTSHGTQTNNANVPVPAGAKANDLMVVFAVLGTNATAGDQTGWTTLKTAVAPASNYSMTVRCRVLTASDISAGTVTPFSSVFFTITWQTFVLTGMTLSTADAIGSLDTTVPAANSNKTAPSVTATAAGIEIVWFAAAALNVPINVTAGQGLTPEGTAGALNDGTYSAAIAAKAVPAGATANAVATASAASSSVFYAMQLIFR